MGWPIYSERFLHHSAAGAWTYVVPADMRAVVKAVDVVCAQPVVPCDISLKVGPILSLYVAFQAAWRTENRQVMTVAYQGEAIVLNISNGGIHVTVSGYLFSDLTERTGPPASAAQQPAEPPGIWLNPDYGADVGRVS